jgi:hypothetical protein
MVHKTDKEGKKKKKKDGAIESTCITSSYKRNYSWPAAFSAGCSGLFHGDLDDHLKFFELPVSNGASVLGDLEEMDFLAPGDQFLDGVLHGL